MKITVIGATGMIGAKLVSRLRDSGHEVRSASPSSGVNSFTGEGLDGALSDADTLIDVTNAASFGSSDNAFEFFRRSGHNLVGKALQHGINHYLALSVVGTDRLVESDYFRAKMVQENLIRASGIQHTIVRSTQFFESLYGIIATAETGGEIRLSPARIRPVAADDAVAFIADVVEGTPTNGTVEIQGPQQFTLDELARVLLTAHEDPRPVVADLKAKYFEVELALTTLLPVDATRVGQRLFEDWLYRQMAR